MYCVDVDRVGRVWKGEFLEFFKSTGNFTPLYVLIEWKANLFCVVFGRDNAINHNAIADKRVLRLKESCPLHAPNCQGLYCWANGG